MSDDWKTFLEEVKQDIKRQTAELLERRHEREDSKCSDDACEIKM